MSASRAVSGSAARSVAAPRVPRAAAPARAVGAPAARRAPAHAVHSVSSAHAAWPTPAALLPAEVQQELLTTLREQALVWQEHLDSPPLFWRDSEPFWDEAATEGCPRTLVRQLRLRHLRWFLALEIERAVRLLVWQWWPEGATDEQQQAALRGALVRIGQYYQEAQRRACRREPERGLAYLRAALSILP